jgi:hypothetical protein
VIFFQSLSENSSGRVENGDFRASERSVHQVREHRSAGKRRLLAGITNLRAGSAPFWRIDSLAKAARAIGE